MQKNDKLNSQPKTVRISTRLYLLLLYLSYSVILQAELRKKLESEDVPKYFGFIDTAIGKFGKDGFAVPSGVSFIT